VADLFPLPVTVLFPARLMKRLCGTVGGAGRKTVRWTAIYITPWETTERRKNMAYTKPEVLAQNSKEGAFAAGCPVNRSSTSTNGCKSCERAY
jgi:N-methylhydantoinase B/oxoprolinase/acetone carboxylase alpha subunit